MAIVKMKKMYLLGLKKDLDRFLDALQRLGAVEIADIEEEEGGSSKITAELSDLDTKLSRLKFAIEFLRPYAKEQNPLFYGRPKVSLRKLREISSREGEIFEIVDAIYGFEQRFSRLKTEEGRIGNQIELIKPWGALDIPVEDLGTTGRVDLKAISVPKKNFKALLDKLKETDLPLEVIPVGESREENLALAIYHRSARSEVQELYKEFSVNTEEFNGFAGTPAEIVRKLQERLEAIEVERKKIKEEIAKLADRLMDLKAFYDYWLLERQKKENLQKMADTEKIFVMKAYVPENSVESVKKAVNSVTDAVHLAFEDPAEDDDIPVVLSNPRLVQPFEIVTELYSLPDPRGIDPNVYMAPFFFVFFGMMVSDAAYGLVLSLLSALALWKLKLAGMGKKLVELLFLGGISTFIWGMIFGSWFGDLIKIKPLWLNPLDNPMAVLYLSFAMGLVQIYTGIILSAYKNIRNGKVADALMDQGLWLVFLTGLIMLAFPSMVGMAKYIALAGAAGLVLTQGRTQRSLIKKFTSGLLSLYNVTSYLSDVLSYSRLLALGLATGVIATVINTMAKMLGVNIVGYIAMIAVMVGGHIFNIAVNALGAYVHSSRLQYIEFFGKFYDGGGRPFDPLRMKTEYLDLEDF
ncbi:hypothetical protein AN618_07480 [Fervidicola ferrireducens]|uniref:Uncharacterized protein n=1 Tax=Fervidicola ferrireducens TaxID=520764 RepID=A0A140LBL5_9FIRM|nr:V-type ATP synthase subunit I [Fervidicola ferrireducens]KXG77940.1 hypothetical protein AN618_07480 [Fervidicola ferrireducens]